MASGCLWAQAETFSEGALNFEISGENTCRLIASPDAAGTLTLPPSVMYENSEYRLTEIASGALTNARALEALLVPGTVTDIGSSAARGCTALRVIELSDGLTTLGAEAFVGCTALESAVLPDGLTTVPRRCFYRAAAMRELQLGRATAMIETQAFEGCTSLESVVCMAPVPPAVAPYALDPETIADAILTVPKGARQAYAADNVWGAFRNIVESDYGSARVPFTLMFPSAHAVTREPLGSRVTLEIVPDEDWRIAGLYLDGADVTADISSKGYYTTPALTDATTLSLTLQAAALDDDIATRARIRRMPGVILVEGIDDTTPVTVYDLDGRTLYTGHGNVNIEIDTTMPVILTAGKLKFKL